jgi:hypothetical protein
VTHHHHFCMYSHVSAQGEAVFMWGGREAFCQGRR